MNVDGMSDALESVRSHPLLPKWPDTLRRQVNDVLAADTPTADKIKVLHAIFTEWEAANVNG
jgi:hypothetical protein